MRGEKSHDAKVESVLMAASADSNLSKERLTRSQNGPMSGRHPAHVDQLPHRRQQTTSPDGMGSGNTHESSNF